ncbi:hypothetical protein PCK1_000850 [Pneumocystis canis]|nr:hypothetical protein PCK1_000850 [Pneumocystis canis]
MSSSLDEWQLLKTLALELSTLTGPSCCECSLCESRLFQSCLESQIPLNTSYGMEKPSTPQQVQSLHPLEVYQPLELFLYSSLGDSVKKVNTTNHTNNKNNTSYDRLFEAVSTILDRSSTESLMLLARHAWCQDISLYSVWQNIQQSRKASLQLLVRSLSSESSASLVEAAATASPAGRRFRKDVQQLLEKVFQCKPWPNPTEKTMLARRCGLTVRQVGVWFSNRRARRFDDDGTMVSLEFLFSLKNKAYQNRKKPASYSLYWKVFDGILSGRSGLFGSFKRDSALLGLQTPRHSGHLFFRVKKLSTLKRPLGRGLDAEYCEKDLKELDVSVLAVDFKLNSILIRIEGLNCLRRDSD